MCLGLQNKQRIFIHDLILFGRNFKLENYGWKVLEGIKPNMKKLWQKIQMQSWMSKSNIDRSMTGI